MKNNKYILPGVLLVVGLIGGFAGGYYFKTYQQQGQRATFRSGAVTGQRFNPNSGGQRTGGFGGAVEGDIISIDDKSVTVKLSDGSSKIIFFSDTTTYSSSSTAKKTDLKQGNKIMVFGKSNTDGSVTADRVQLNPIVVMPSPSTNK